MYGRAVTFFQNKGLLFMQKKIASFLIIVTSILACGKNNGATPGKNQTHCTNGSASCTIDDQLDTWEITNSTPIEGALYYQFGAGFIIKCNIVNEVVKSKRYKATNLGKNYFFNEKKHTFTHIQLHTPEKITVILKELTGDKREYKNEFNIKKLTDSDIATKCKFY